MYAISNTTHAELLYLLSEMEGLPKKDNKTINARRRAKLMIQKLKRCKKQTQECKKVNTNGFYMPSQK